MQTFNNNIHRTPSKFCEHWTKDWVEMITKEGKRAYHCQGCKNGDVTIGGSRVGMFA